MLLSVILPSYNSEKYIAGFIENLQAQRFIGFELIIVDGESNDGTASIIKAYQQKDNRIRSASGRDEGIYDAMNKGIGMAKGDWLYFMGADDIFFNNEVLEKTAPFLNENADIVYGDSIWMPENVKEEGEWDYDRFIHYNINHQRIFYRRELFQQYPGFNIRYKVAADHELNIRFFCNPIIRKKYISQTIAVYHSGGYSAQKTDEAFWEDWNETILKNFKPYLSQKTIYGSLGVYIRYLIDQKRIGRAMQQLVKHFVSTRSFGFAKLMISYYKKSKTSHAC